MPTINCTTCGKSIHRIPSKINNNNYCSKKCLIDGERMGADINCDNCGASFYRKRDEIKRSKLHFCSKDCYTEYCQNRGHSFVNSRGYRHVCINGKAVPEHRVVVQNSIGRKLSPLEVVHHINHDKLDNRIENLEVLTPSAHTSAHRPLTFDINEAIKLRNDGLSFSDIGVKLGLHWSSIWGAFKNRGMDTGRRFSWDVEVAKKLRSEGKTYQAIADLMGKSENTIRTGMKRHAAKNKSDPI